MRTATPEECRRDWHWCECGNWKGRRARACDQCTALDSDRRLSRKRAMAGRVLACLRLLERATAPEIASAIGEPYDSVRMTLRRAESDGFVRRIQDQGLMGNAALWVLAEGD